MKMLAEFYAFMLERESIRLRRLAGFSREHWTKDPIFQEYSFTNVKRHHDRTTTLLKREIYDPAAEQLQGSDHIFDGYTDTAKQMFLLHASLFRYFGTIQSARMIGWLPEWTPEQRARIAHMGALDDLSFTSAYIVPSGGRPYPKYLVVLEVVDNIWERSLEVVSQKKWEDAVDVLKQCWGVGSFMAKEVYLDYILATGFEPEDWTTWTPVGPGGKRGASVIQYGDTYKISESEALDIIRTVYAERDRHWPDSITLEEPPDDAGNVRQRQFDLPKLDLTDIQFQCCEFDKYQRVVRGDGKPKRRFWPTSDDVTTRSSSDIPPA